MFICRAEIRLLVLGLKASGRPIGADVGAGGGDRRRQFDGLAGFGRGETLYFDHLALGAVVVAVIRKEADLVLDIAGEEAVGGETPGLRAVGFSKAELVEGDGEFDRVTPFLDPAGAVPDGVPACVEFLVEADPVPLDSQGIPAELEIPAFVVERVERQHDPIVVHDLVPVGIMSPDRFGLGIIAAESGQEIIGVGDHKTFGLDGRFHILSGHDFIVQLEYPGRFPGFVVQDPVDLDREAGFGNR
jgi:hypothetical protein